MRISDWSSDVCSSDLTDYTYDATHGGMLTRTAPAAPGGVRPQTRYAYTLTGITHALTSISSCQTGSSCAGTVDALKTTIAYGGASEKYLPARLTSGRSEESSVGTECVRSCRHRGFRDT